MATIEAHDGFEAAREVFSENAHCYRLEPAAESPPGYVWLDLMIDASRGERECARAAWEILSAMQRSAEAGRIDGFRIVSGEQWLAMGDNNATIAAADRSTGAV